MLRSQEDSVSSDLRLDVIGGTVLIDASGVLEGTILDRLRDHLDQLRGGSRPVVLDLTDVTALEDDAIALLRTVWRDIGDRLRVVATPGSAPARALKAGRLRRFAVHATLSGALTDASG